MLTIFTNPSARAGYVVGAIVSFRVFLLPSQPCHFPVYQGGLGSKRRLFLYNLINDILSLVIVWLKGQLHFNFSRQ